VLIKPNETFSFLSAVGSITKLDGYKEAYVIKGGKTVLGDGGGVCQVSTTLYRAALYAGLPIVERVPHSYRVGYYEPPVGFDATIYQPGGPDLKFKNDTGNYILIQTFVDEENMSLTFDFYGTSDGRVTQISDPVVVSTSPPPPTKYQDDPTLPAGTEKQIDTAHAGAKVYFTRRVVRANDILINEKVWSSYIPWAAVILRGIKP
jgi:vancomycin resistance protein YoaR